MSADMQKMGGHKVSEEPDAGDIIATVVENVTELVNATLKNETAAASGPQSFTLMWFV